MLTAYIIGAIVFFVFGLISCMAEGVMPSIIKLTVSTLLWPFAVVVLAFEYG